MAFNNGYERRKFETEWEKLRVEYAAAGMDAAAIGEMYRFDLDTFNSNRRYAEHTQAMPFQQFDDDGDIAGESNSALLSRFFDAFAVMPQETPGNGRHGWIEDVDSEKLSKALHRLPPQDMELLTLHVFEGYSVSEIAQMQGVSQPAVSKKLMRIKNFLKKI